MIPPWTFLVVCRANCGARTFRRWWYPENQPPARTASDLAHMRASQSHRAHLKARAFIAFSRDRPFWVCLSEKQNAGQAHGARRS